MTQPADHDPVAPAASTMEAVARVVAIEGGRPVLEPEPTGSCGGCMS